MKIGFQVWGQFAAWDELMAAGERIDQLGFDGLWSNDHMMPSTVDGATGPVFEGWMTLAAWAERTRRVTLGCLVSSVSYRSPTILVKMATALDHASGGRAVLGIGAGWHVAEHRAFGFDLPSLGERLDRLEEGASICRQMLDGGATRLDGRWFTADGARNDPPPAQARLPLLIGGSGERRTLPIVARYADVWNGEGDPATFARKSAVLDERCRERGRRPGTIRRTVGLPPPLIRERRADAVEALTALLVRHGLPEPDARKAAAASPLVGTAEQVASRLREYQGVGAAEVMFDWPTPSDEHTLEVLAGPVRAQLTG
jgi:alkanesulfonate monooxygenase SsuD/methylene tetrahydromethanopterin reductase-like flavin-dependent oxidoreductase (luciferase family)